MEYRFAIGTPSGPRSSAWKLWSRKDDAYLCVRVTGQDNKFSFHRSGKCRWAGNKPRSDGSDRAMLKWERGPLPEVATLAVAPLVHLAFPTDHLSTALKERPVDQSKKLRWLEPAPPGMVLRLTVFQSRATRLEVERILDATDAVSELLAYAPMRNSISLGMMRENLECEPVNLSVPDVPQLPGKIFHELAFLASDDANTRRPVRILVLLPHPLPGTATKLFWELGGYEVSRTG